MSDKQPLLPATAALNEDAFTDTENRPLQRIFAGIRRRFGKENEKEQYEKLEPDAEPEPEPKNKSGGFFQIFRYARGIDFLLIAIRVFLIILESLCSITTILLVSTLTSSFVVEAFSDTCPEETRKALEKAIHQSKCPWGVQLNPNNYEQLHKYCKGSPPAVASGSTNRINFHNDIMRKVISLFIVGVIDFVGIFFLSLLSTITAARQTSRIQMRLFESLVRRNVGYFDTHAVGELNNKLFDNIDTMNKGVNFELSTLTLTLLTVVIEIIVCFVMHWKLTLVLLCIIPFFVGGTLIFAKIVSNESIHEMDAYGKADHIVQEVFSSLRTVLSLNGGSFERKRYGKEIDRTQKSSVRKGTSFGLFFGFLYFMTFLTYAIGFIFGFIFMDQSVARKESISKVIAVVILFTSGLFSVGFVSPFLQSFEEATDAASEVFTLMDEEKEGNITEDVLSKQPGEDIKPLDINGDIEFKDVTFAYPARKRVPILQNLSVIARAGETTAFVGSSGCGKSTCISLLFRYYEPSEGQVTIHGRPLTDHNVRDLRENIGVVNQEPILFDTTIYENILFGKQSATQEEVEDAAQKANAHNFIMQLPYKYETRVGERGVQLSGGQKQRIALARALVKQPSLLLLDEATSALDNDSEKIVQEALEEASKGRTTIVIAHRLATIQKADHICVFHKGNVVEQGTHSSLMEKEDGKYRKMVEAQLTENITDDDDEKEKEKSRERIEEEDANMTEPATALPDDENSLVPTGPPPDAPRQPPIFFRLMSMNRPECWIIVLGCIMCVLAGSSQTILAIILAKIINGFRMCGYWNRRQEVIVFSIVLLIVGLAILFIRVIQFASFAVSGSKLTRRVRARAFACLLRQEIAYFDLQENSSGAISTRLSSNALAVQQMTGTRLGIICETAATFILAMIFGFVFNWRLALIALFPILFVLVIIYINTIFKTKVSEAWAQKIEKASMLATEVLHNIRSIKQLTAEQKVLQQFTDLIESSYVMIRNSAFLPALCMALPWCSISIVPAGLFLCALNLVESKQMSSSDTPIVFAIAIFFVQNVPIVMTILQEVGSSMNAAKCFFELFDRKSAIDSESTEGQKIDEFRGEIEFDTVNFAYPTRPAIPVLNNFKISIKPGQHVALVGASGCGKSTIIQLLERFYDVTGGHVRLDGADVRDLNIQWVRTSIGLVSQEPILFDLTIAENISYGREDIPMEDIIDVATKANIHHFIQQLPQGYETKVGQKGGQLSGGEKQRVAIARTLLRRPKILLLDEATSAMDSHNEHLIQQTFEQVQKEDPSQTMVVIAHRLSTIRSCDLIYVLQKGRVVESGSHDELIQRRGRYYRMNAGVV